MSIYNFVGITFYSWCNEVFRGFQGRWLLHFPRIGHIHSRRNRSNLFQTVVSNHCGCTPRGVRGVKRPEILWEIQKYSLPGRPSSQNWVKSLRNSSKFLKKWQIVFDLLHFGWMVDLAMSVFEFLTKFLVFWHPWVCIRIVCWKWNLKQIEAIPPSVYGWLMWLAPKCTEY